MFKFKIRWSMYKINCKNLIHLPRWQLPCNASSLRIDYYNILIYHELGAHSNAPCIDTWSFHHLPSFFSLQPSIQNTLHATNMNAQYKWWWNHITMCTNKEWSEDESCNNGSEWNDFKKKMQLLAYEGVTSWHFHSTSNLLLSFNSWLIMLLMLYMKIGVLGFQWSK